MTNNYKHKMLIQLFIVSIWMFMPSISGAAGDAGSLLNQYRDSSLTFYAALQGLALSLLFKLWAIEMSWASIKWVLERKPFEDLMSHWVSSTFPPLFLFSLLKWGLIGFLVFYKALSFWR